MAFDITNKATQGLYSFIPVKRIELTDLTASSTTQGDFGTAMRNFRAYVVFSAFTEGDAGVVSSVGLEVSDVANFASNVDTLHVETVIPASQAGLPTFTLAGSTPLVAGKRYARVSVSFGTNASGTYDAILEAC